MKKPEFVCIQPKNKQSKNLFDQNLKGLHSCKVLKKEENKVYVKSIAGEYYFWIDKKDDKNWTFVK